MREKYLETDKFPTAELTVVRSALQMPQDRAEVNATATAQMTIHGQTKPVTIRYRATRAGTTYRVQGTTHLNMNDYGVNVPSYMGVTVKPDVDITVTFSLVDS
jgi:polyisoprenoid-binding protein YceI